MSDLDQVQRCAAAGQYAEALDLLDRWEEQQGVSGSSLFLRAHILVSTSRWDEAAQLTEVLREGGQEIVAWHVLQAEIAEGQARPDLAIAAYRQACGLDPHDPALRINLSRLLLLQQFHEEAVAQLDQALQADPASSLAYLYKAAALGKCGRPEEGIASAKQALHLMPASVDAKQTLAALEAQSDHFAEAATLYAQLAIEHPPAYPWLRMQASALLSDRAPAKACAIYRQVLQALPDSAEDWNAMGGALVRSGEFASAMQAFEKAIACDPALALAHVHLGIELLRAGEWESGWREYAWREQRGGWQQPAGSRWDGTPQLGSRLLLYGEQGVGDMIQFLRYLPLAKERVGETIVSCRPELQSLIQASGLADQVITEIPSTCDFHLPMMTLGQLFCRSGPSPSDPPYLASLFPPSEKKATASTPPRIGLVWAGNPQHTNDANRSIPPSALAPWIGEKGIVWLSFQRDGHSASGLPIPRALSAEGDWLDTARALRDLDLLISVDTGIVHLAGAMGLPVWILLPLIPDWRWGTQTSSTPWYPSATLHRQRPDETWHDLALRLLPTIRDAFDISTPSP